MTSDVSLSFPVSLTTKCGLLQWNRRICFEIQRLLFICFRKCNSKIIIISVKNINIICASVLWREVACSLKLFHWGRIFGVNEWHTAGSVCCGMPVFSRFTSAALLLLWMQLIIRYVVRITACNLTWKHYELCVCVPVRARDFRPDARCSCGMLSSRTRCRQLPTSAA